MQGFSGEQFIRHKFSINRSVSYLPYSISMQHEDIAQCFRFFWSHLQADEFVFDRVPAETLEPASKSIRKRSATDEIGLP
jgi:hypothetical protein